MSFLLNHESDVSLDLIWYLFALPLKHNGVPALHSTFYVHRKGFTFAYNFVASTLRTSSRKNFAFPLALVARLLHLHLHHAHIYCANNRAFALATGTRFEVTALGAGAFARFTVYVPR